MFFFSLHRRVSPHGGPQISSVSLVITADLIESCHIPAVNGLLVEAAEVKGFLKGQLTHHCCFTPFSSSHPHLLNLNHGWEVWPFISSVSSGCLFHLIPHVTAAVQLDGPSFLIPSPLLPLSLDPPPPPQRYVGVELLGNCI